MPFNNLSNRLQNAIKKVSGKSTLTEKNIDDMMREIRLSLLEADVNFQVVKEFTKEIKEEAIGKKVLTGLNPGQQLVKIVNEKLTELLGGKTSELVIKKDALTVMMLVGLQGAGKTTHIAKLANLFTKANKKVLMVACDIYRPAAIEQLKVLGKQTGIAVFSEDSDARTIAKDAISYAKTNNFEMVLIDTAGRLAIDEPMMQELVDIKDDVLPDEILLVVDSMTGQDAVNVCEKFHERLQLTGAILTKLDGDTRGGAALSIKKMSGVAIKYVGIGEKIDDIEVFHPDRMANRILGMGDVLTLIEKAEQNIDEDDANSMMEKMVAGTFDYNDMLKQFKMIGKMGSLSKILGFLPGISQMKNLQNNVDDDVFKNMEIIINSMTKEERQNPDLLERSSRRRQRIANGSGKKVTEVNKLRQSFQAQKKLAKQMAKGNLNPEALMKVNQPRKSRGKGRANRRRW